MSASDRSCSRGFVTVEQGSLIFTLQEYESLLEYVLLLFVLLLEDFGEHTEGALLKP